MSREPDLTTVEERSQPKQVLPTSNKIPFISVVIDGFKRKEFIIEAVKSVRNQDLNESAFELIVLRAFDDNELDKQLAQNKAKVFDVKDISFGEAIAFAVERSIGEVICFLDDDDKFQPNKLSRVYDLFSADPDLCYYHHGQIFCNANSDIISNFKLKRENPGTIKFENEGFKNLNSSISKSGRYIDSFWFNLSSISVRKKIFNGKVDFVRRITGHPDDLMFYLAFSFHGKASLLNTNEPLTVYRVHNSTTNIVNSIHRTVLNKIRIKQYKDFCTSSSVFTELMHGTEAEEYTLARYSYELAAFYNTKKESLNLIKQTLKLSLKDKFKLVEFNRKKRFSTYFSFIIFALFYAVSRKIPAVNSISILFPSVESFQR